MQQVLEWGKLQNMLGVGFTPNKTDRQPVDVQKDYSLHNAKLELVFVKHYAPNICLSPNMAEYAVS